MLKANIKAKVFLQPVVYVTVSLALRGVVELLVDWLRSMLIA